MTKPRNWPTHLFRLRRACASLDYAADDLTIALGYVADPFSKTDPPENLAAAREVIADMLGLMDEITTLLEEIHP